MRVKPGAQTNCTLYFCLTRVVLVKYFFLSYLYLMKETPHSLADWSFTYYGLGLRNWFRLLNYLRKSSWLYKISTQVQLDNLHYKTLSCPAVVDWPSCRIWLVERENVSCPNLTVSSQRDPVAEYLKCWILTILKWNDSDILYVFHVMFRVPR